MSDKEWFEMDVTDIRERIKRAAALSGRSAEDITLIGVSKTVSADRVCEAVAAGISDMGENRTVELLEKYERLPEVRWHLIGHLQTNKVRQIIDKVHLIHSCDSLRLAEEINRRAGAINKVQDILLQVNITGEESKFGVSPDELSHLTKSCSELPNIHVKGLMTIPPHYKNITKSLELYRKCNKLRVDIEKKKYHNVDMSILSMGMSEDFEAAIEAGATHIRLGRILFGERYFTQKG